MLPEIEREIIKKQIQKYSKKWNKCGPVQRRRIQRKIDALTAKFGQM